MNRFIYSGKMLYILVALLLLTFFLPDIIGPLPALAIGFLTIGFSLFVYNKWNKQPDKNDNGHYDQNETPTEDNE